MFIVKGNRSFDNYFGTYPGTTQGTFSNGAVVTLYHMEGAPNHDMAHDWISAVDEVGPDYTVSSTNCVTTLAPNGTCTIQVQFAPSAVGSAWAQVNITDSDPGGPHEIRLTGTGVASSRHPAAIVAPPIDENKELVDDGDDD
ncbi:MAG TPA: hypothetical protein VMP68_23770 [Candidatus Eisenbacteria bacterium]|nr:hypothetical protein [Candidatus Eisenbacteria bacterium]